MALTAVNDLLNDLHIVNTGGLVPLGLFLFILSYSFLISVRFSRAFSTVEHLTEQLLGQNQELVQAVKTARENLQLKKKLDIQEKRALKLKVMQGRLSSMLNRVEDALLAVTPEQKIVFSNQAVEALTGYSPGHLIGRSLSDLFHETSAKALDLSEPLDFPQEKKHLKNLAISGINHGDIRVDITASFLDLEDEQLMIMVLKKASNVPQEVSLSESLKLIENLNWNRGLLETMDVMFNLQSSDMLNTEDKETLNTLVRLLDKRRKLTGDKLSAEARRVFAVRVMNTACTLWTTSTRTTKAELADKSGLWTIYLEKDGYARTQTLDKYLSINTLPTRPRWNTILATAEFVLATCDNPVSLKEELKTSVEQLKISL